jgi:hypothetical protein
MTQGLDGAGEVTIGLTPALLSSVEPSGIAPTGARPGATPAVVPLRLDGATVVPDAVPPDAQDPDKAVDIPDPIVLVLMPVPSNVEPVVPVPEMPVPAHGSVLADGVSDIGLRPPGESSVAPSGIPTGPAVDVDPGTPRGDVGPIAGVVGVSGAI